jgi:transposase-like protein
MKSEGMMTVGTRRQYTEEFKREAVRVIVDPSVKTRMQ